MLYTKKQINSITKELQKKFIEGTIEGYEVVVALIVMVREGKIKEDQIKAILMEIHFNNPKGVLRALQKAYNIIDDKLVNDIIYSMK